MTEILTIVFEKDTHLANSSDVKTRSVASLIANVGMLKLLNKVNRKRRKWNVIRFMVIKDILASYVGRSYIFHHPSFIVKCKMPKKGASI